MAEEAESYDYDGMRDLVPRLSDPHANSPAAEEQRPYSRDRSRSPANGNGDYKDSRDRSASPDRRDRDRDRDQREPRYVFSRAAY